MRRLGLARHERKGVWDGGACVVEHLGFVWDSLRLQFTVTVAKQVKVRDHARSLLREMARGRGWVGRDSLRSFDGVATSLHLTLPLALLYTRAIHHVLSDFSEANKPAARGGASKAVERGRAARKEGPAGVGEAGGGRAGVC